MISAEASLISSKETSHDEEPDEFTRLPVRFVCAAIYSMELMFLTLWTIPGLQLQREPQDLDYLVNSIVVTVLVQILMGLLSWCLWKTTYTDPGTVPNTAEWRTDPDVLLINERDGRGDLRFNRELGLFYPDRSHAAGVEGNRRIVLKMDHWCPWVNAPVGFYNYKYFWLSCMYIVLTGVALVTCFVVQLNRVLQSSDGNHITVTLLSVSIFAAFTFTAIIGALFYHHVRLIVSNMTTLEWMNGMTPETNPYNLGSALKNFALPMGLNPHLWLFPVGKPLGDGLYFHYRK